MQIQNSFSPQKSGILYLVPTPIGNLEDMTFRAVAILKDVDLIAAEDTRNTQKLLNHFEIETKQISFHEHNTLERIPQLISKLQRGENIAQVSDAGMPSISDPGKELVQACLEQQLPVVPLPGANAGLTALIASGIAPQPFYFHGFLPRKKKEQLAVLSDLNQKEETLIFYESPYRLRAVLENLQTTFGVNRRIVLCRELTKRYEEFVRGTVQEAYQWAVETELRGEFCLIVAGNPEPLALKETEGLIATLTPLEHVEKLIATGENSKEAIKEVAKARGLKKQDVYKAYHTPEASN